MDDKTRSKIWAVLLEAKGALLTIATADNLVGNTITRIDHVLGELSKQLRSKPKAMLYLTYPAWRASL